MFLPAQYVSIIHGVGGGGGGESERVRDALLVSLAPNFSKTTENETVKMTDIKTVKVDKCSPYTFSFQMSYSQEHYKKVVANNGRKTKSAAAQLVLQPAYTNKLPIGDKKKADILNLRRKKSHSQILCYFL
jgi:hypothetical protein